MLNGKVYENIVLLSIKITHFQLVLTWERADYQFGNAL